MASSSEIILSNQTHGGDSSIQTLTSDKFKGDGYYGRSDGFHTIQYNVSGFIGLIVVQSTLAIEPTEEDWFTLSETEHESLGTDDANNTGGFVYNFTGNYVWVRVFVSNWTDGVIRTVLLNH
jgi:hypothetical protein